MLPAQFYPLPKRILYQPGVCVRPCPCGIIVSFTRVFADADTTAISSPSKKVNMAPRATDCVSDFLSSPLRSLALALLLLGLPLGCLAAESPMTAPPRAGTPELFPEDQLKPGMKGIAWTVFQGMKPEPVPVEIIGVAHNMWGPRQDIIVGKLTGKVEHTNVAGGMSGSPVYIDGKLVGAISLRLSVFSPDAICGITPIRLMLEVNEFDKTRPADSRTPDKIKAPAATAVGTVSLPVSMPSLTEGATMTPIATPITMSGFSEEAVQAF